MFISFPLLLWSSAGKVHVVWLQLQSKKSAVGEEHGKLKRSRHGVGPGRWVNKNKVDLACHLGIPRHVFRHGARSPLVYLLSFTSLFVTGSLRLRLLSGYLLPMDLRLYEVDMVRYDVYEIGDVLRCIKALRILTRMQQSLPRSFPFHNHGAVVDVRGKFNRTLLYATSWAGNTDVIRWLLDQGADPNCGNNCRTPLHVAAHFRRLEAIQVLLKHNADINSLNITGKSSLCGLLTRNGYSPGETGSRHGAATTRLY